MNAVSGQCRLCPRHASDVHNSAVLASPGHYGYLPIQHTSYPTLSPVSCISFPFQPEQFENGWKDNEDRTVLIRLTATSYVNCPTLNKIFCWFTRNNEQLEIFTRDFFMVSARALRTARHRITGGVTRDIIVTRLPNNWLSTTLNRHSHCFPTTKLPNSPHILHACMEKAPSPISVNIASFIVKCFMFQDDASSSGTDMSICRSEALFSSYKDAPGPGTAESLIQVS